MDYKTGILIQEDQIDTIKSNEINFKWCSAKLMKCDQVSELSYPSSNGYEIILFAKNMYIVEQTLRLIFASYYLINSTPHFDLDERLPSTKTALGIDHIDNSCFPIHGFARALEIARKASFSIKQQTVIYKYKLACTIHANNSYQLSPENEIVTKNEYFLDDYIRYANNIVNFYSILEELELGINLKKGQQSFKDGKWDQNVLDELRTRLKIKNINYNEPILWLRRSKRMTLEEKRRVKILYQPDWARNENRDSYIAIEDAIDFLRVIRNKVAAHNIKKEARSITVYDVENANRLAKRVILENLKLWK
ncbi:hypothetical protein [Desulfoplanes formicivorans]|uniref:Uncharacterized protein n=1 Tax=Desulfoplanes formicivorans TaxID=1592317 RepID=A0A194AGQ2_9BACT|nr:hypothetical protein [Desulfoplanes formicivorans]GAU08261.1 hypothetical protein DPF_0964 [Desulfoplanes formicivorans]